MKKFKIFFDTGEKLRFLRRKVNLTQSEVGGKLGKVKICQVEHNERCLKISDANYIASRIMAKAKKRGIKLTFEITGKWLMDDVSQQIKKIIADYTRELRNEFTEKKIKEVIGIVNQIEKIKEVDNTQKFVLYDLYVNYFQKNKDLSIARKYLIKMYEISTKSSNISQKLYVIKRIINIFILIEKHEEDIIAWGKIAEEISKDYKHNTLFLKAIWFNMASSYNTIENSKQCNKYLDMVEKFKLSKNEKIDVDILRADCLRQSRNFTAAEKILKELILECESDDKYRKAMLYRDIAKVKYHENNPEAIKLIEKAASLKLPDELEYKYIKVRILYIKLKIYSKFDFKSKIIEKTLKEIISMLIISKDNVTKVKTINFIYDHYNLFSKNLKIKPILKELKK